VGAADHNIRFARKLRREMSLPEVLLWQQLRKRPGGLRFRRQFPLSGYVIDFACLERRLAIEIDGEAHDLGNRPQRDEIRDRIVAELGYETLRIPARDVLGELDAVLKMILDRAGRRPLHQPAAGPPPRSGEDL
jgi:very-short-patch-repair endonuclease